LWLLGVGAPNQTGTSPRIFSRRKQRAISLGYRISFYKVAIFVMSGEVS
jgi:hypothetical protein